MAENRTDIRKSSSLKAT